MNKVYVVEVDLGFMCLMHFKCKEKAEKYALKVSSTVSTIEVTEEIFKLLRYVDGIEETEVISPFYLDTDTTHVLVQQGKMEVTDKGQFKVITKEVISNVK